MKASVHLTAPAAPKAPSMLGEIHIRPIKNGVSVSHYGPAGSKSEFKPEVFGFHNGPKGPAINQVVAHLEKHVGKIPWLGGKTMEPRMPGSGKARRIKQVETSSYPAAKGGY